MLPWITCNAATGYDGEDLEVDGSFVPATEDNTSMSRREPKGAISSVASAQVLDKGPGSTVRKVKRVKQNAS